MTSPISAARDATASDYNAEPLHPVRRLLAAFLRWLAVWGVVGGAVWWWA